MFALKAGFAPEMFKYGSGYLPVKDTNGHILFYDKKGEVYFKSPNKVKGVGTYNDKMFAFYTEDGEWGVMDYQCETLVRPKYTHTQLMTDGRILAVDDKRADVFDDKGNTLYRIDDYNYVFYWEGFGLIAATSVRRLSSTKTANRCARLNSMKYARPKAPATAYTATTSIWLP